MDLNKSNIKKIILIVVLSGAILLALWNLSTVLDLAGNILSVFMPFIIGLCIAFVTNVLLRVLEKLWDKIPDKKWLRWLKKIKRGVCIVISEIVIIGVIFILMFMIIPEISRTFSLIADAMPEFIEKVEVWWDNLCEFLAQYSIVIPHFDLDFNEIASAVSGFLEKLDFSIIDKTVDFTGSLFTGIFNIVLGWVFSLYVLAQKEKLGANLKKALSSMLSEKAVERITSIAAISNKTFSNFVTGQLTEAVIIGLLCFIGMLIFSMPYAAVVSVLVGFTALIPVFGAFIGTGIGAFLILMVDPMKALWFIVFIVILQQLEGNLIYPRVVGKSVGLPGIWVLVVVTVSGGLFGVVGMLISVPTFTVVYTIVRQSINKMLRAKKLEPLED